MPVLLYWSVTDPSAANTYSVYLPGVEVPGTQAGGMPGRVERVRDPRGARTVLGDLGPGDLVGLRDHRVRVSGTSRGEERVPGSVEPSVAGVQRIAREPVVVRPDVVEDEGVLVDGEVLVLRPHPVERGERGVGHPAEGREPGADAVTEVAEHRELVVVEAPVVLRVHRSRRQVARVAVGRGKAGVVDAVDEPGLVADALLSGQVRVSGLLAGSALAVVAVVEDAPVEAGVHAHLVDRGGDGGREDVVRIQDGTSSPHDDVVLVVELRARIVHEGDLDEDG